MVVQPEYMKIFPRVYLIQLKLKENLDSLE